MSISEALGMLPFEVDLDSANFEPFDCYSQPERERKSNITSFYWNNLSGEERLGRLENHGMTGKKHSQETREKMSKSAIGIERPNIRKAGTIIAPNGKKVKFRCISHFCKEHNLHKGHITEVLQGKRKSHKGWHL